MRRISPIAVVLLPLIVVWVVLATTPAQAQAVPLDAEKILVELQGSAQEDRGFTAAVVLAVQQGRLPRSVVESAFIWAKRKESLRYQYSRRAVIALARQRGIRL